MFPEIGKEIAKNLLEYFDTITNIINASEKELAKLYGIGKKTAHNIKNVVSKELNDYRTYVRIVICIVFFNILYC